MAESLAGKGAEAEPPKEFATVSEETESVGFKAIVLGATGATGCYVVGELLTSKDFKEVTLLGRRKVTELPEKFKIDLTKEESSGHLKQIVIDLEQANEENSLKYFEGKDAYFTCFGTTRGNAGSKANFKHIDYGYNVKFGEMAKKASVGVCSLLSSSRANPSSFFNLWKVKGEIENVFTKLQFPFLTIFRPGVLDRKQKSRFVEKVAGVFMTKMPVDTLASAIVADSLSHLKKQKQGDPQSHILTNQHIFGLAKAYSTGQEPKSDTAGPTEKGEKKVVASQEVTSGDGMREGKKSDESMPADENAEEVNKDQAKDGEGTSDQAKGGEGNNDQAKAEEGNSDHGAESAESTENKLPETAESKVGEEQSNESEKVNQEPGNDAGNEMHQTSKESNSAE